MPLFSVSTCPSFCHFFLSACIRMSSSDEEQRPGPSEAKHVSEVPERDEDLIENDLLISLVHERVPLWDTQVPQHLDVTIRRLWNEVAKAMWDGWDNAPDSGPKCIFAQSQNTLAFEEGSLQ
ncbi:uncharacterized protein LOC143785501 isoform X2 [Ranitomeya variabilis]|uniref:uncharacterized protein LOC143785501 isoform X2 n=1 Tax=Ranitomeya variabilis TaxID=490064 RepID=UPI0040576CCA